MGTLLKYLFNTLAILYYVKHRLALGHIFYDFYSSLCLYWHYYLSLNISNTAIFYLVLRNRIRDDTHMTSMKNVQFSRPPHSLAIYVRNSCTPLTLDGQLQATPCALRLMLASGNLCFRVFKLQLKVINNNNFYL